MSDTAEIERAGQVTVFYVLDDMYYSLTKDQLETILDHYAVISRCYHA